MANLKNKHDENLNNDAKLHSGHRERVRCRLAKTNMSDADDYYLMEYTLHQCIPRKDTNPLAHNLINAFGSFANVCDASVDDLVEFGLTVPIANFLHNLPYMFRNYQISKQQPKPTITCAQDVFEYMGKAISHLPIEEFYIICLDGGNHVISRKLVSFGSNVEVSIKIQDIVKYVLSLNAHKIVMVHNHPTTDENPSIEDIETTKRLFCGFHLNGIELVDHLIINYQGYYYSFSNNGWFAKFKCDCQKILQ